jgi:serine/threonine protein phosphatase PrpC
VLALLYEANETVHAWGNIEGTERPLGAACATVAYLSPAGNLTLFQAGDTCAFVYRARGQRLEVITGAEDVAGRAVRRYIGLGPALSIEVFPVGDLESGDLLALVTDGVYPKGFGDAAEVRKVLEELADDPERIARELVDRSRNRGSRDDITALVLAVG